MLAIQLAAAIEAVRPSQLDHLARTLWKGHGAGLLSAEDAQRLAEAIEARRARRAFSPGEPRGRQSVFPPRRPQHARRHPERIERRRRLAASAPLPAALASAWTTSELAVLRIIGDEVHEHRACDRSLAEIAARAGVCRSLAQRTIRRAAELGLLNIEERPRTGAKNLPNVVRIISAEWRTWLDRGPKEWPTRIGSRNSAPTDTHSFPKGKRRVHETRKRGSGAKRRPDLIDPPFL